jgi:SAM-dependent methyltransferase
MLGLARRRAQEKGLANVTFQVADASTHSLEPSFDLLFSRFGVMFFDDPASAFRNLRRALRPGGRLAFVCWGPVVDNPWYRVPMEAASAVVSLPAPPAPGAPGPFAFGDRVRLTELLERAGFRDVRIDASAPRFVLGPELESAATHAVNAGPVSRVLLEVDEPTRARVRAAIMDRLQAYAGADGIALPASTWVVRAN